MKDKTKSTNLMETKLNKIMELSNKKFEMNFKWLVPHFKKEALISCFHELDGKKAVGIDGITKEEYSKNLEENIDEIIQRRKSMNYRPTAVKEVLIPKEGEKEATRPLG